MTSAEKKQTVHDLYSILDLTKDATSSQIKHAYRKACLKYHPDKNLGDKEEAEKMFQIISNAFSILSDSNLRHIYDTSGFKGLRRDGHTSFGFDDDHSDYDDEYNSRQSCGSNKYNSKDIFDKFFSDDNPFTKLGVYDTTEFNSKEKKTKTKEDNFHKQKLKADEVHHDLPCTLEELSLGTEKVIKVTRKRFSIKFNKLLDETRILKIAIRPGWKEGTQINMNDEGDAEENQGPGDLVFTIKEIPHPHFHRDTSNNIIFYANITLCEALTDCIVKVPTLRGRTLVVPCPEVIHSKYEKRLIGEGISSHTNLTSKGDLIIRFNILFPLVLNVDTKRQLRDLLSTA